MTSYPTYKYRVQYQALETQLLADLGKRDEAAAALESLIRENPTWPGRADAMVRLAVDYDSLAKPKEEAAAYERFAAAYPKDARAADAQYNAGVTYLQGADTAGAIRAYGTFAAAHPRDPRTGAAQATRVALIKAGGNVAAANVELAKLCARPSAEIKDAVRGARGRERVRAGARALPALPGAQAHDSAAREPHARRRRAVVGAQAEAARGHVGALHQGDRERRSHLAVGRRRTTSGSRSGSTATIWRISRCRRI